MREARTARASGWASLSLALALTSAAGAGEAPGVPGKNVNAVGPTPVNWLYAGNPRKQNNEPSCAVAPGEPEQIFCGDNDYRAVDDPLIGDAWPGVIMSRDGGHSFISGLHPCHLADPACSIGQKFGADPNVLAVPGLVLYNFIAGWRDGSHPGGMYVSRWSKHNREVGPPWVFLDLAVVDNGTSGRFLDKPGAAVSLAAPGSGEVTIPIPEYVDPRDPSNVVPAHDLRVPAGAMHLGYSVFVGNDNNSGTKIIYRRSNDWGHTFPINTKLSESVEINQGVSIATKNFGRDVFVVWRRARDNNESAAIMYATSSDGGSRFSKASVLADFCPFDQTTGSARFRTTALPVATSDNDNFYVFYADRGEANQTCFNADGTPRLSQVALEDDLDGTKDGFIETRFNYSRIRMAKWNGQGAGKWTFALVDPELDAQGRRKRGHQMLPAVETAGGVTQVVWSDSRDDRTGLPGAFIEDLVKAPDGQLHFASEYATTPRPPTGRPVRRSIDIYGAQLENGVPRQYLDASGNPRNSVKISRYPIGLSPFPDAQGQRRVVQLEHNFPNGRLFRKGTRPFKGDYDAVAAPLFRRNELGQWVSNADAPAPGSFFNEPIFYIGWTDNRGVRGNVYYDGCDESDPACASKYADPQPRPPQLLEPLEGEEGVNTAVSCTPAQPYALSRNQNIYVAAVTPGLSLSVVSARKPISLGQRRAYVLYIRNSTATAKSVTVSVPADVGATFDQFSNDPVLSLDVTVPRKSGSVRTIFVDSESATPTAPLIVVTATDNSGASAPAFVALNSSVDLPLGNVVADGQSVRVQEVYDLELDSNRLVSQDLENQDLENQDLENAVQLQDLENQALLQDLENTGLLQDLENQDLENFLYEAQDLENQDLENQDLENQALYFQDLENQDLENQDLENKTILFQDLENQDLENQDLENGAVSGDYTEVSWKLGAATNTTSGYNVKPILAAGSADGVVAQLFVTRSYLTQTVILNPDATSGQFCTPQIVADNQVVYNAVVPLSQLTASIVDPRLDPNAPSFYMEPDNTAIVTLRFYGDADFDTSRVGLAIYSQAKAEGYVECDTQTDCGIDVPPDTTAPMFEIEPAGNQSFTATSSAGYTHQWGPATALDDRDGEVPVSCMVEGVTLAPDGSTFSYTFPAGKAPQGRTTEVSCFAQDSTGNYFGASFQVTVVDEPPSLATPADISAEATATTGAEVSYAAPTANDTVDGPIASVCAPASGSTFALGATPVSCSATDSAGNVTTVGFTVYVRDTTPPVLSVPPAPLTATVTTGTSTIVDFASVVLAVDSTSPPATVACVPASGSTFPIGDTTVSCTATDSSAYPSPNTSAVGAFIVRVLDGGAPTLSLPTLGPVEATGPAGAVVNYTVTANDENDGPITPSCSPASGSTFPVGTTAVSCNATDAAGNSTTGSFDVVVRDTIAPTLTVPADFTVTPDASGTALVSYSVSAADAVTTSPTISCSPASGTVFPGGTTSVSCTATDAAGNQSSKSFKVTVGYAGIGYFNKPNGKISAGSAVPLEWRYYDANGPVDSFNANPVVTVYGPFSRATCPSDLTVPPDPIPWTMAQPPDAFSSGSSNYRYVTGFTWKFNWKTDGLLPQCYALLISSETTGQSFVFTVTLNK